MQLIGTESGRVSLMIAWEEIRPLNGIAPAVLQVALLGRYKFQYPPAPARTWEEAQNAVREFNAGSLEHEGRLIPIRAFVFYSDAILVECLVTDDAEIVLKDLISWSRTMGFREFLREPLKIFTSRIVVKFDFELEALFGTWREISDLMLTPAQGHYGDLSPFGTARLEFRSDARKVLNHYLISNFTFERRPNEEYAENRYICNAPLPTAEHIRLLEMIEEVGKRPGRPG